MFQQIWTNPNRVNLVCVDSYDEGVLKGRFCHHGGDTECFSSLSQFLLKMEELLDRMQMPQAYTEPRTFSMFLQPENQVQSYPAARKGFRATFELRIIFRQHTSWQGTILWKERKLEYSFRSVLELVFLMDSALRRTAVSCYALEGFYPPSVAYMGENYGLSYDRESYTVHYEVFAANLMPENTVLDNEG